MLDLAILGLLKDEPHHGYELKKQLNALLGPWSGVSSGSLYPALARLEKRGDVVALEHPGTALGMPMTGALSGEVTAYERRQPTTRGPRNKKVYEITRRGEEALRHLLTGGGHQRDRADDRAFAIRVAFCRHLDRDERVALFRRRRQDLEARLAAQPDDEADDAYLQSARDHDRRSIARDLDWVDELLEHENALDPATAGSR